MKIGGGEDKHRLYRNGILAYIDIPPPSSSQVTLLISCGLFGFNGETGKQGVVKNACSYIRFRHHLVYFIHWKRSLRDFDAPMTLCL